MASPTLHFPRGVTQAGACYRRFLSRFFHLKFKWPACAVWVHVLQRVIGLRRWRSSAKRTKIRRGKKRRWRCKTEKGPSSKFSCGDTRKSFNFIPVATEDWPRKKKKFFRISYQVVCLFLHDTIHRPITDCQPHGNSVYIRLYWLQKGRTVMWAERQPTVLPGDYDTLTGSHTFVSRLLVQKLYPCNHILIYSISGQREYFTAY